MFNNLTYLNKYLINSKFFIILFLFWLSLNTGSKYLNIEFLKENLISNELNFIRAILPYIIAIYLAINLTKFKKKSDFDIIFKLFFAYGLFQILGLIYYQQNLYEHYWVVCLFSLTFYYHLVVSKDSYDLIKSIFFINIFFISIVFTIFIFLTYKENIFSPDLLYYSNSFYTLYQNEALPRSSGLSRMGLIIFLFLNALYLSKICSKKLNLLFVCINIFIISTILLLQSRGAILSFILIFILINFFYKYSNFKLRLKYIFLFLFVPCLIFIFYPKSKNFIIEKFGTEQQLKSLQKSHFSTFNAPKKKIKIKNIEIELRQDLTLESETDVSFKDRIYSFSNNRLNAWEFLLQIFFKNQINEDMDKKLKISKYKSSDFLKKNKKNILTGHGPQADRHFLHSKNIPEEFSKTVLGPFGAHASNGYIYSLVCSGVLGFICFVMINIIIMFKILKIFFYNKLLLFNNEPLLSSSILITIFLQFRILIENSFSVFGVDLLILISAYLIINNKYKEINS